MIALPVIIPMAAAAMCLMLWSKARPQAFIAIVSSTITLAVSVAMLDVARTGQIQVVHFGSWTAPFGISFAADILSAIMVTLCSIVGLCVVVFSVGAIDRLRAGNGMYPLSLCLIAAVNGAFLTADIFNLYVWFELMLLSSFVLLTLGGQRGQLEGAIKYVTLNLVSSLLFLIAVGLIYGTIGTLNMADLAVKLDAHPDPALPTALSALLLIAFAIKAAAFPFFFWLPASYHTPPPVVSALFAGLLTKVGVYALIRAVTLLFDQEWEVVGQVTLIIAGFTMVTGVLGAVVQSDMRRILSFHIVSQIGYMLMGLGIAITALAAVDNADEASARAVAVLALAGSVFYILHHILVKTNLFLIAGAIYEQRGTTELARVNGLLASRPFLASLFMISALSLAGIPVLSGFWAKLILVRSGLEAQSYMIVIVSLCVSILTLYSMTKIWISAFWGEPDPVDRLDPSSCPRSRQFCLIVPIIALCICTTVIGIFAEPFSALAVQAAEQLLSPDAYINAVLDGARSLSEAAP